MALIDLGRVAGAKGDKGDKGDPGQDATINGQNAVTIAAGDNIALSQSGGTLTIAAVVPDKTSDLTNDSGYQTAAQVEAAVDAKVSGLYKPGGSATLATLPALAAANAGYVYNMTEAFTTTADFKEGAGHSYPAGTNVVIADAGGGAYKYDALGGMLDGYATNAQLDDKVDKVSGKGLSTNDYTTAEKDKLSGIAANATANAPATAAPLMDGAAAVGTSVKYAREDHRHPTDTSRADAADVAVLQAENALLRELIGGIDADIYRTASGNPATFSDGKAANLKALRVTITPTQSGSGDPAPDNVRPITGVSSVTVTRTGESGANPQSVTVALTDGANPLTVYGGTLDATTGTLTVTGKALTLPASGWSFSGDTPPFFRLDNAMRDADVSDYLTDSLCSHYRKTDAYGALIWNNQVASGYYVSSASGSIWIRDNRFSTVGDFQAFLAGASVQIAYPLAAPVTYQLTPAPLAALAGYNSVSADAGTLSVTYLSDPSIALGGG